MQSDVKIKAIVNKLVFDRIRTWVSAALLEGLCME
jgi:hypothetical protein